jgi:hypothetical protein
MDVDDSEYITVNELTEKLKEQVSSVQNTNKNYSTESNTLKKENLEKFLLEKTGELVSEGLEAIRELKNIFVSNPNAEEIDALANAFKAVTSGLSVLKDIQVTNSKIENNLELKEMDIKAKKELKELKKEDDGPKLMFTRDEVFKKLLEKSDIVDAEFVPADLN